MNTGSHRLTRLLTPAALLLAVGLAPVPSSPAWADIPPVRKRKKPPKPEPAAPERPLVLESAAVDALTSWMDETSALLEKAARGDGRAKASLIGRAADAKAFGAELERFAKTAEQRKATEKVALTAVTGRVTLWVGNVPIGELVTTFWRDGDELKVLRLKPVPPTNAMFGGPPLPLWNGDAGKAFGRLAGQVMEQVTHGKCQRLPMPKVEAYEYALPKNPKARKQTIYELAKMRASIPGTCVKLDGMPYTHLTWRLGSIGGVAKTADGDALSFQLRITAGKEGRVALDHVGVPVVAGTPTIRPRRKPQTD